MTLNRTELKKISYDFNSLSNRLLQADFNDYNGILDRFVRFLREKEIIHDYIADCGECDQDLANGKSSFLARGYRRGRSAECIRDLELHR